MWTNGFSGTKGYKQQCLSPKIAVSPAGLEEEGREGRFVFCKYLE